jgi:hypothetical protein
MVFDSVSFISSLAACFPMPLFKESPAKGAGLLAFFFSFSSWSYFALFSIAVFKSISCFSNIACIEAICYCILGLYSCLNLLTVWNRDDEWYRSASFSASVIFPLDSFSSIFIAFSRSTSFAKLLDT